MLKYSPMSVAVVVNSHIK